MRKVVLVMCLLAIVSQVKAANCGTITNPAFKITFNDVNEGQRIGHEVLVLNEDGLDPCDMIPTITYLAPVPRFFKMGSFVAVDPNIALGKMNWCSNTQVNDVNQAILLSQWISFEPGFADAGTYVLPYKVTDRDNNSIAVIEVRVKNVNAPAILLAGRE